MGRNEFSERFRLPLIPGRKLRIFQPARELTSEGSIENPKT
jgi:hypothetical protein